MSEQKHEPWLEINDQQLSAETLEARIEERLRQRRAELGPVSRHFPTFQAQAPVPQATAAGENNQRLHDVLRQLQQLPPPATHPALSSSPATRLPLLGRFWALMRSQAHQLVLFYVNRHLAHQAQTNHLVSNALHELGALLLAQQQEVERLQARLSALEQNDERAGE